MTRKQAIETLGKSYVNVYEFALKQGDFDMSIFPHQLDLKTPKISKEFIQRWAAMWPKQKATGLDYPINSAVPICEARFTQLIKKWNDFVEAEFSEDAIILATREYLRKQENNNWAMTKKSHKFIMDENGSMLAQMINGMGDSVQPTAFFI